MHKRCYSVEICHLSLLSLPVSVLLVRPGQVEKDIRDLHPLNSGVIGIHANNTSLRSGLLNPWTECCLNSRCIQELGLSRKNHQYEQAALSVLAYQVREEKRLEKTMYKQPC